MPRGEVGGYSLGGSFGIAPGNSGSIYKPEDIIKTGLSFRDLTRLANLPNVEARQILFVLDACYAADALNLKGLRANDPKNPLDQKFFEELANGRFVAGLTAGGNGSR